MLILVLVYLTSLIVQKTVFTLQSSDRWCTGNNKELQEGGELFHGLA